MKLERRAMALSDRGYVVEAIELIGRAIRRRPAAPLLARRAQFHLQRRNYAEALSDIDAAIHLSPRDVGLRAKKAEIFALTDRLPEALAQLHRAVALAPDDEGLRLVRLRAMIQQGLARPARAEIAALLRTGSPRAKAEALFGRGCLELKLRRPGLGGATFRRLVARWPKDDPISMRARFYWTASRAADPAWRRRFSMKETPVTKPHLFLCGLGIFPPYTATLEVLHALGRCDVLFNNVAGPEVRELLAEFCADVRPASYQAWQDEPRWADAIFAELARGKTVGFVTRGHPLVFGGLARELVRRCRAQGVGHQTFGAVSSIDHLLAVSSLGLGDDVTGMQVMDMPALVEGQTLNVRQPLLATFYYGIEKRSQAEAVQRALERSYPPGHECLMYGPKYDAPPAVVAVGDFARRYPTLHSSLMLYLPPLADGGDQSRPRGSKAALRARARRPAAKGLGARG